MAVPVSLPKLTPAPIIPTVVTAKASGKMTTSRRSGKRGRKPAKIDVKAKLERSRQSARECRARKKLRYQYLEELVSSREKAIFALRQELESFKQACVTLDRGKIPAEVYQRLVIEGKSGVLDDNISVQRTKDWCEVLSDTSEDSQDSMEDSDEDMSEDLAPEYERSIPLMMTTKGKGVGKSSVTVPVTSTVGPVEGNVVTTKSSEERTKNLLRLLGASEEQLIRLSGGSDGGHARQPLVETSAIAQSHGDSGVSPVTTISALPNVSMTTDSHSLLSSDVLPHQITAVPAQGPSSSEIVTLTEVSSSSLPVDSTDQAGASRLAFEQLRQPQDMAGMQLRSFPGNFSEEDIHDLMDIIIQSAGSGGVSQQ